MEALPSITIEHTNPWFSVLNRGGYYTIEPHQIQVGIIPIVEQSSILLVRVHRPVIDDDPLETPGGSAEANEDLIVAARRELYEETGVRILESDRFTLLPPISLLSSRKPTLEYIYEVNILKSEFESRGAFDSEIKSVELYSFEQIKNKLISGEIYVSLSMAILSRFILSRGI